MKKQFLEAVMGSLKNALFLAVTILIGLISSVPATVQAQGASADQYVASGQQLLNAKNYTQAAQYYYAALKIDPNNFAAYQGLGNCYYLSGRKSDALTFYQRALSIQPSNAQLAQFVQNLQGQVSGGAAAAPGSMGLAADPLTQGSTLFQQHQYAASIPYFQRAAQQTPNDYRPFYYAGYAYYMTGNTRFAALYFAVANAKQPNASIQSYADRTKATLSPDDQQWVDDQLSKYSSSTGGSYSAPTKVAFGFNFMGGSSYFFANPDQIINGAKTAGYVSIGGATPNMVAEVGVEPYLQFGKGFELDFGAAYIPVGSLSYTWLQFGAPVETTPSGTQVYGFINSFQSSMVLTELGMKILFGDKDLNGYIGLGANLAPISMTLTKNATDNNGQLLNNVLADPAAGSYSTVAFGGYARFGLDFILSKNLSLGPFLGVQILTATNFQKGGNTLLVNQSNGDIGLNNAGSLAGQNNTTALTLDYSNINLGMELKFSF
jgi:tetratricopeptide (TPR) repeat protein